MSVRDGALSSLRETFAGEIVLPGDGTTTPPAPSGTG